MSTIKPFSQVMPSLTKHSYNDFKSVQKIIDTDCIKTYSIVHFNTALTSNLCTIAQNLDADTLLVIFLHLIDNQQMIFTLFLLLIKVITNLIFDKKSYLFANNASVKITSFQEIRLSCTKYRPRLRQSIYYCMRLLRAFASFSFGLTI